MLVEANLGVNKVNYFVERSLNHFVKIDQTGRLNEELQITYQNYSQSESFPGGRYKNYLRVLVPENAELKRVLIDNVQLDESKITQKSISGKQSFGFLVEVPVGSEKRVKVEYRLEERLDIGQPTLYLKLVQKQSGIKDERFFFLLSGPPGVGFFDAKPAASLGDASLLFGPQFDSDLVFEAKLAQ
jgi:hypothetical protein